jgi:hypothetical protein
MTYDKSRRMTYFYDWRTDAIDSYTLARQLQREKLLRDRAWKSVGPRNETERKIVEDA